MFVGLVLGAIAPNRHLLKVVMELNIYTSIIVISSVLCIFLSCESNCWVFDGDIPLLTSFAGHPCASTMDCLNHSRTKNLIAIHSLILEGE